jgi:hypothetical protein
MAAARHAAAALALVLLLAAHTAAAERPGQGSRMTAGKFRSFGRDANKAVAVAGAPDTDDVSSSAIKQADEVTAAAAGPSINTNNNFDLCYDLNANSNLSFADVAFWQGKYLQDYQFMADTTCYLQWLPVRRVTVNGVLVPLSCSCLDPSKCGRAGGQPCCRNMRQWRAATNWAVASSYVWRTDSTVSDRGDGYVCEWITTRPVQGYGILVASVSYSVVWLK